MVCAFHSFSSPQNTDGAIITALIVDGVLASRTGSFTVVAALVSGSNTGTLSVLFSVAPNSFP